MNAPKTNRKDLFAGIASQKVAQRAGLIEPLPPELPERHLPAARSDSKAAFRPSDKVDTPGKLDDALRKERIRVSPYLRNLAPQPASSRTTVPVKYADWRMETAKDRRDFASTLKGAGAWKRVRLPHYGGPVGRAAAFYRTTFHVTRNMLKKGALFACFKGVDYKAHVFVNGSFLGSHEGFFAPFEFNFTAHAHAGDNILLVKIENDANPIADGGSWGMNVDGDKIYAATGLGWNDPELGWHHCPPGMGICQPVYIEARPSLHLADLFIRPMPEEKRAELQIEVFNCDLKPQPVSLSISIFGRNFKAVICRDRLFNPSQQAGPRFNTFHLVVDIPKPKIWDLDTPWLYEVQVSLSNSDTMCRQFGMRTFRMDTENRPYGRFFLNGREVRLRGANTMGFEQQDVFKADSDQLRDDILLAKLCRMNFWRLTQRPVESEVYEMCDRLGLLTQTDLPLFGFLPRRQFCEAVRQVVEMERLVRNHPCNIMVSYINEPFAVKHNGKGHRQCTRAELERFFEAASQALLVVNPDRVIKPVDGDYDPPGPGLPDNHCYNCWYNGHGLDLGKLHKGYWQKVKQHWRYGCGEFGAEGLDRVSLMHKHYPKHWLPQSASEEAEWTPARIKEAQTGRFHYLFFDTQRTLEAWVQASLRHQAWATRIMTEAFRRDNRMNTFAIHLFIDAFPAGWMKAIMDVERSPKPAFFAYREALTPLMANIRTDRWAFKAGEAMRFELWICNDTQEIPDRAQLRYQLEVGDKVVFAQKAQARIERCASAFQGFLTLAAPAVKQRVNAVLRLALCRADGVVVHDTAITLAIFPAVSHAGHIQAIVVGTRNGKASGLARELGMKPSFNLHPDPTPGVRQVFLIDDFTMFEKQRTLIENAVKRGSTAVFLELPAGEIVVGRDRIKVDACGMGARHFVSRATGHPLVDGFEPEDFRLWYDPALKRVAPLLETCFTAKGWIPILTAGNGEWRGEWSPVLTAAEKRHGEGSWRICQVVLAGRTAANPVAAMFARRLFEQ